MTTKQNKKSGPAGKTAIYKPYLKGNAISPLAAKRGMRVLVYLIVASFAYFLLGQVLVMDTAWLRILINLAMLVGFYSLLRSEGARMGEGDVAFSEIALSRKEAGQELTKKELDRCFHPLKGYYTAIVGALPLVLVSLVFAFIAQPQSYTLGALPGWLTPYLAQQDIGLALSYYQQSAGLGFSGILRLVVRLLIFPFVNIVGADNAKGLLLLERLSPILLLLGPLAYGWGYQGGVHLRARIHGDIVQNRKKQERKQKRQSRAQKPEQPKQLI